MAYSRRDYYIFGDGESINFHSANDVEPECSVSVPNLALEIFITALVKRGELDNWVKED